MKNLFLAVLLTGFLFLIFKLFQKLKINSFHAVVINYQVCVITGLLFLGRLPSPGDFRQDWLQFGILTGALFLPTFYLMAYTVEKISVSVATVANKMSLILPVMFSYLYLRKGPETFTLIKCCGVALALLSILLTSVKKQEERIGTDKSLRRILLPPLLFLMGGTIDTMVNFANYAYLEGQNEALFTLVLFGTASGAGLIALAVKMIHTGKIIPLRDAAGGVMLGIPNFFSLYFLLKALSDFHNDGALVYPVFNISVILSACFLAVLLFREKLSRINLAGICLSVIALIMIFW